MPMSSTSIRIIFTDVLAVSIWETLLHHYSDYCLIGRWTSSALESGVLVTCDVDYLCVNFSRRPLCFRLRLDVSNRRQTRIIA